jgi:hypothetical protein
MVTARGYLLPLWPVERRLQAEYYGPSAITDQSFELCVRRPVNIDELKK